MPPRATGYLPPHADRMLGTRNAMKVLGMVAALCCAGRASAGASTGALHGIRSAMTQQQQRHGRISNMNESARRRWHMEVSQSASRSERMGEGSCPRKAVWRAGCSVGLFSCTTSTIRGGVFASIFDCCRFSCNGCWVLEVRFRCTMRITERYHTYSNGTNVALQCVPISQP